MVKMMKQEEDKPNEIDNYVGEYICPKCGKPANGYKIGDCLRILCPSCGCDAVTTYFDELDLDEQVYKLELLNNDVNISNIKSFASIFNLHYLEARNYIVNKNFEIKDNARKIKTIKEMLDESGIKYCITPKFEY